MKTTMFKTTLMMIAASFALSWAAPVVAHADENVAHQLNKHRKPKKKKVLVKNETRTAKQAKALAGLSETKTTKTKKSHAKIEAGSAKLADMQAPASSLKTSKKNKKNVSNDMVFDGSVVHGQYQIADGTTSVVENEKSLTSLIAPRRDFKDRMQAERSQQ